MPAITLAQIAALLNCSQPSDGGREISGVATLPEATSDDISFLGAETYLPQFAHHFSPGGYAPSPVVLAAAIAHATTTIRIASAVVVLPLYYEERTKWIWMMKQAVSKIACYFNSHRMMRRYAAEAYLR